MLHRIAWTESARPRGGEEVELEENEEGEEGGAAPPINGIGVGAAVPVTPGNDNGGGGEEGATSLQDNKCWLVWEGLLRDRVYSAFKARSCPTDRDAKEFLGEKMRGYWDQAKNWKPEDEELF